MTPHKHRSVSLFCSYSSPTVDLLLSFHPFVHSVGLRRTKGNRICVEQDVVAEREYARIRIKPWSSVEGDRIRNGCGEAVREVNMWQDGWFMYMYISVGKKGMTVEHDIITVRHYHIMKWKWLIYSRHILYGLTCASISFAASTRYLLLFCDIHDLIHLPYQPPEIEIKVYFVHPYQEMDWLPISWLE